MTGNARNPDTARKTCHREHVAFSWPFVFKFQEQITQFPISTPPKMIEPVTIKVFCLLLDES